MYKDIDIYYIGYITIKKIANCENIHSVNPLYLITYSATGHFKEKHIATLNAKCVDYRCILWRISRDKVVNRLDNSVLEDKAVL